MNNFKQTAPQVQLPPAPPPQTYSDRSFLHSWVAAVGLPLVLSIITGMMCMVVTATVIYMFNGSHYLKWMLPIGALTTVLMWFALFFRWIKLTDLEKVFGDLNGDGYRGEPPTKVIITVNKVDPENQHVEVMSHEFPVSDEQIGRFFTTVKTSTRGGKPISRRKWTPKNVHGFSEGEWDAFYGELVKQRLVMVRGNECVLTPEGEEIADQWYAREYQSPPSPTDEEA